MQFASYQAFRTAVQALIEGDDDNGTTFKVSTLDLMIGLAEARVYRDLRASTMEKPLSQAITSNSCALPADLLEVKEVYFTGSEPLDIVPLDRLRKMEAGDSSTSSQARYCAQDGDTLRFWPVQTGTALGTYYATPESLKTITWGDATTFARYPEVFLFACMVEALPWLGMEGNIQLWEGKYQEALGNARENERMRVYGGGPLRQRHR